MSDPPFGTATGVLHRFSPLPSSHPSGKRTFRPGTRRIVGYFPRAFRAATPHLPDHLSTTIGGKYGFGRDCLLVLAVLSYLLLAGCSHPGETSVPSGRPGKGIEAGEYPVETFLMISDFFSKYEHRYRVQYRHRITYDSGAMSGTLTRGKGSSYLPGSVDIGKQSERLFSEKFMKIFKKVEKISTTNIYGAGEGLVLIPRIGETVLTTYVDREKIRTGKFGAELSYGLKIRTRDGKELVDVTGRGTAEAMQSKNFLALISLPHATISQAFAEAGEIAFGKLMEELSASKAFNAYVTAEIERQARPAQLVAEVRFDDSRALLPNGRLDAGETGDLVVTVKNRGAGPGYDVTLGISTSRPEIGVSSAHAVLGRIPPGESREVRVPVSAGLRLPTGETSLVVSAGEKRGYDARTVEFLLPTVRLEKPSIGIVTHEINDGTTGMARGNGNGIPESGETIELLVFVRNDGPGPTAGATLSATAAESGVEVVRAEAALGIIHPHRTARGVLVLSIPRTWDRSTLVLDLQVRDGRGKAAGGALDRRLALEVRPRAPVLVASTRMLHDGHEIRELTNDRTVELEVVPHNKGALDAEDVTIQVRAEQPGVSIPEAEAAVGALRAGAAGAPRRWAVTLPRTFDSPHLRLAVRLRQRGFPGREARLELPVRIRRPALAATFTVAGQRGAGVEQNETADLEVRIDNTGDLPARNVRVMLEAEHSGVELQGRQPIEMGTIMPGERARGQLGVRVRRSVPPGEQALVLATTQSDFPALNEVLRVPVHSERTEVQRASADPSPANAPVRPQPPSITLVKPREDEYVRGVQTELIAVVADQGGIDRVTVAVNGAPVPQETVLRGLDRQPVPQGATRESATLAIPVALEPGRNVIDITAYNTANLRERHSFNVTRLESQSTSETTARIDDDTGTGPSEKARRDQSTFDDDLPGLLARAAPGPADEDSRLHVLTVGIGDYADTADVPFADRSAIRFAELSRRVLGVREENLVLLTDREATLGRLQGRINTLLARLGPEDRLLVYYAGHGVPGEDGDGSYLLAQDGGSGSFRVADLRLDAFLRRIARSGVGRALVFIDACFSGRIDKDNLVFEGVAVAYDAPAPRVDDRVTILSAGRGHQFANQYRERGHRLFGYHLMRALLEQGPGLTAGELHEVVLGRVQEASLRLGPEYRQEPELRGRRDVRVR